MAVWVLSAFRDRSAPVMLTLTKSLVRLKLEYCCPVWNPSKISDIQKLESIQRYFTRKTNSCKELIYWDRLKKLKVLSLQRRRELYCIIHVWKILAPTDLEFQFSTHHRLGIRASIPPINKKAQLSIRTDYDKTFRVQAAQLFNVLPTDLRSLSTLESFKAGLGRFLEKYPDTPQVAGYTAAKTTLC